MAAGAPASLGAWVEEYGRLLRAQVAQPGEPGLARAAELGAQLGQAGVPLTELIAAHARGLADLAAAEGVVRGECVAAAMGALARLVASYEAARGGGSPERAASEAYYREVLEHSRDLIYCLRIPDGVMEYVSRSCESLTGLTRDEITALGYEGLVARVHPDDRGRVWPLDVLQATGDATVEFRFRHRDDTYRCMSVTQCFIADGNAATRAAVGVVRDVTEQRRTDEELRRHREHLETLVAQRTRELEQANARLQAERDHSAQIIQGAAALVCVVTPEGLTTFANPAVEQVTGYRAPELIGRNWFEIFYPGEERVQIERLLRDFEQGDVRDYEMVLTTKTGEKRTISWNSINRRDAQGRLREIIGLGTDVTERKRAEEAVRDSRQHLESIINAIADPVFVKDEHHRLVLANDRFCALVDRPREELLGRTEAGLLPPDRVAVYHREDDAVLASGAAQVSEEEYTDARGVTHTVVTKKSRYVDAAGARFVVGVTRDITEHRFAEREVRLFKTISDSAGYGAAIADIDGRMIYVNAAGARMHGYEVAEMVGRNISMLYTPEQMVHVRELTERLRRGETLVGVEVWRLHRDGHVFPTLMNITSIKDEHADREYVSATAIDITDRKQAEELLRIQRDLGLALSAASDLQEALRLVLDAACHIAGIEAGGIYLTDPQTGGLHLWAHRGLSPAFVDRESHWPADEPHVQAVLAGEPFYGPAVDLPVLDEALQREGIRYLAVIPIRHEGRVIGSLNLGSRALDELPPMARHALEAVAASVGGAMARVRAELALRASEERFRVLCTTAPTGIFLSDDSGQCLYANPSLEAITGLSAAECYGHGWLDVVHPQDRDGVRAEMQRTLAERRPFGREFRLLRRDGAERWVHVRVTDMATQTDGTWLRVGTVEDITVGKAAQEANRRHHDELAHAARVSTLGEMTSGLAHELTQPLSAILYHARACGTRLNSGAWSVPQALGTLEKIAAQAERAGDFIRRMKAFVRKAEPGRALVDVNAVVREALTFAAPDLLEHDMAPRLELADQPLMALLDRIQIEHVVLNLLRNAIEALLALPPAERLLVVRTARPDADHVQVGVHNNGPPLDAQVLEHVFDPFFTTKPHGTGLGLSISRTIVEDTHGGELWVHSGAEGGTTFGFTLPVTAEAEHERQ